MGRALRLVPACLLLFLTIPESSPGPASWPTAPRSPLLARTRALGRELALAARVRPLALRGGVDAGDGGEVQGDAMDVGPENEEKSFAAMATVGKKLVLLAEDDKRGLTRWEMDSLVQANLVVPSARCPTLLDALEAAPGGPGKMGDVDAVVFVRRGIHNLTDGLDVELQRPYHLVGQSGAKISASAIPRPKDSLCPVYGGGRLRLTEASLGSTFSGISWACINVQAASLDRCAILFDSCDIRTSADAYVSCVWVARGSHISLRRCALGGYDRERECTNGLVLSESTGAIDQTKFEFCFGAAVSVNDNSTLRASSCAFLDSFSALACGDGTLREADDAPTIEGDVSLVNCTVRTVELWRGSERPKKMVDEGRLDYVMDHPEYQHVIDQIAARPTGVVEWNPASRMWTYTGMSKKSQKQLQARMKTFARPGEVDPKDVMVQVRKAMGKKPWESSEEEVDENKLAKHIEDDSSEADALNKLDFGGASQRRGHKSGAATRDMSERYASSHGHPGHPPRQRNKYFGGIGKTEWSGRKGRRVQRRS